MATDCDENLAGRLFTTGATIPLGRPFMGSTNAASLSGRPPAEAVPGLRRWSNLCRRAELCDACAQRALRSLRRVPRWVSPKALVHSTGHGKGGAMPNVTMKSVTLGGATVQRPTWYAEYSNTEAEALMRFSADFITFHPHGWCRRHAREVVRTTAMSISAGAAAGAHARLHRVPSGYSYRPVTQSARYSVACPLRAPIRAPHLRLLGVAQ